MLDGFLGKEGHFSHHLPAERQAWIYAVWGDLTVRVEADVCTLQKGHATTVGAGAGTEIVLESSQPAHFVLTAAKPIREPFVKAGPLVMSTAEEVRQTLTHYSEGRFGRIPKE